MIRTKSEPELPARRLEGKKLTAIHFHSLSLFFQLSSRSCCCITIGDRGRNHGLQCMLNAQNWWMRVFATWWWVLNSEESLLAQNAHRKLLHMIATSPAE